MKISKSAGVDTIKNPFAPVGLRVRDGGPCLSLYPRGTRKAQSTLPKEELCEGRILAFWPFIVKGFHGLVRGVNPRPQNYPWPWIGSFEKAPFLPFQTILGFAFPPRNGAK